MAQFSKGTLISALIMVWFASLALCALSSAIIHFGIITPPSLSWQVGTRLYHLEVVDSECLPYMDCLYHSRVHTSYTLWTFQRIMKPNEVIESFPIFFSIPIRD